MSGENGHKERSYFGERLRQLRESKGMSIQDLAYCLSVHTGRRVQNQEVTKFEDKTRNPSIKTIRLLSKIFDVSPTYFTPSYKGIFELQLNDNNGSSENGTFQHHPLEAGILKLIEAYRNKDLDAAIELLATIEDTKLLEYDTEESWLIQHYIVRNKRAILKMFMQEDNS